MKNSLSPYAGSHLAVWMLVERFAIAGLLLLAPTLRGGTVIKANNNDDLNLSTSWVGGAAPTIDDLAQFDSTLTSARSPNLAANTNGLGIKLTSPRGTVPIGTSP